MSAAPETMVRESGLLSRLMFAIEAHAPCKASEDQVLAVFCGLGWSPDELARLVAELVTRMDTEPKFAPNVAVLVSALVRNDITHEQRMQLLGLTGGLQ